MWEQNSGICTPPQSPARSFQGEKAGAFSLGGEAVSSPSLDLYQDFICGMPPKPLAHPQTARKGKRHREGAGGRGEVCGFQMRKFVRERTQAFFFFHVPLPRSSVSVELSSTSALDHLEIASICGHRKECTHWLPEKEAPGSLSFLPENVPWAAASHRVSELRETRGSISITPSP